MFRQNIKNSCLANIRLENLAKWYLTSVLIFLPFQQKIIRIEVLWEGVVKLISIIDELTIAVFFPIALIKLFRSRNGDEGLYFMLLFPLLFMCIMGLISGMLNGNPLPVTVLGSIDYIKNFLVIFIFAAFFREYGEFKKVFRFVLAVAVCIGIFALVQEVWAVVSRYVFQKDIYDPGIYILRKTPKLIEGGWRFGIYRTASLMYNQNMFGLFSLLILSVYLCIEKKVNYFLVIPLLTGVVVSVSRSVYAGFAILVILQIIRGRKWFIIFLVPAVFLLLSIINNIWDSGNVSFNMESSIAVEDENIAGVDKEIVYREYSTGKAMDVWKDRPFWGAGPGMFGGPVSVQYNSYLYEEYNFLARAYLNQIKSIDQFWPQLLAEVGIIGAAAFAGIIMSLLLAFYSSRREGNLDEKRGLFTALIMFTFVLIIYAFGSGLNLGAALFTYSAFAGMGLSSKDDPAIEHAC